MGGIRFYFFIFLKVLDQQQEINATISSPLDKDDTLELEEELEALLSEKNEAQDEPKEKFKKEKVGDQEEDALKLLSELTVAGNI